MIRDFINRMVHHACGWIDARRNEHAAREVVRRLARFGKGSRFWGSVRVIGADEVEIGENVHVGDGAWFRGEGGLKIGDNTHLSRNVVIYTVNHRFEGERLPYDATLVPEPVVIGSNVWIGMNVCIAPGTTIGDGSVIGMGTVVSGIIPPLAIVVGGKKENRRLQGRSTLPKTRRNAVVRGGEWFPVDRMRTR